MNVVSLYNNKNNWALSKAGGKGNSLYQLYYNKANVPKLICITTDAYSLFLNQKKTKEQIEKILQESKTVNHYEELSNNITNLLAPLSFPQSVIADINKSYKENKLDSLLLAVRSSATAEDLPEASFAGQHDSFLNISGFDELLVAIKKCWLSLWTPRAISYREKNGIDHLKTKMAVVIQEMVEADISGVLFTVNPVKNDYNEAMLNAVDGMGEFLVSGKKTPQEWVYDKETNQITFKELEGEATPILNDSQLKELFKTGQQLEKYFEKPQDIEWSISKGEIYVLQSRPITTFSDQEDFSFEVTNGYWTRMGLGEWLQKPMSPLFSTMIMPELNNATDKVFEQKLGIKRPSPTWKDINGYYFIHGNIRFNFGLLKLPFSFLKWTKLAHKEWISTFVPNFIQQLKQARDPHKSETKEPEKLLEHIKEVIELSAGCYAWIIFSGMFAKWTEALFKYLHDKFLSKDSDDYRIYISGYPSKSIQSNQVLWELAEEIKNSKNLKVVFEQNEPSLVLEKLDELKEAKEWIGKFYAWVANYGHQVFELDVVYPTFQDNPSEVIAIIKRYVDSNVPSPVSKQEKQNAIRVEETKQLKEKIEGRRTFSNLLAASLHNAQEYAKIRESRPFYLHLGWSEMRKSILNLSEILRKKSILEDVEDIFFLKADELNDIVYNKKNAPDKDTIERRKKLRLSQFRITSPIHVGNSLTASFLKKINSSKNETETDGVFKGYIGNKGIASGYACLVHSPSDFSKFRKGDILVAPYTTPAWTPLLSLASGVVTETGGALSHAAIVAREYDIPAIIGVKNIIEKITDGDWLEVNGNKGIVKLSKNN